LAITTEGLVKTYRGRTVVNDVGLTVERGEIVGLLGPNGAGKSTTFYIVVGLIKADAGKVYLDGADITRLPMYKRARMGIGYLAQEPSVFRKLSVEENIMLPLQMTGLCRAERRSRLERALADFRIKRIRKSKGLQLSGGEARRVEVARAVVAQPSYLLLDEPFLGVDPITIADIQDMIRALRERQGIGILITDHNVRDTLAITDRAYIMNEGQILVSGPSDELVENPIARKFYLGERFNMSG